MNAWANRLTAGDRDRIGDAIRERAHRITTSSWDGALTELRQLGIRTIGCTEPDLHDCELNEIDRLAREALREVARVRVARRLRMTGSAR